MREKYNAKIEDWLDQHLSGCLDSILRLFGILVRHLDYLVGI